MCNAVACRHALLCNVTCDMNQLFFFLFKNNIIQQFGPRSRLGGRCAPAAWSFTRLNHSDYTPWDRLISEKKYLHGKTSAVIKSIIILKRPIGGATCRRRRRQPDRFSSYYLFRPVVIVYRRPTTMRLITANDFNPPHHARALTQYYVSLNKNDRFLAWRWKRTIRKRLI